MSPKVTFTNLYVRCHMDEPEPGGHEIFVDQVSVGFVPNVPGTPMTDPLKEPMRFLGFDPAEVDDWKFRDSLVEESLETSLLNLKSLAETWLWEDRMARGELAHLAGIAAP